jgi:DNA-binding transcriptional MerR regulator/effector-binding domain-containing protein
MGLLVPAVVDPSTGYRAYSPAQLSDATIIRLLRDVGVPLQDIHAVLDARDLGMVEKLLKEQAARFQASLEAVEQLVDDLRLDGDTGPDEVVVRREEAQIVLAIEARPRMVELAAFVFHGETTLAEAAASSGAVVAGSYGACFAVPGDDESQDVFAFLPIASPVLVPLDVAERGVRLDELPGCDVAVLELRGSYDGLDATYRRLATWVAFNSIPAEHSVRELYRTPMRGPSESAVTELLWPIVLEDRND